MSHESGVLSRESRYLNPPTPLLPSYSPLPTRLFLLTPSYSPLPTSLSPLHSVPFPVFPVPFHHALSPPLALPRSPRPRLTVLIPAHNESAGIRATLDSVLLQLAEPDRIVSFRVVWEDGDPPEPDGRQFPHIYGRMPMDAVVAVSAPLAALLTPIGAGIVFGMAGMLLKPPRMTDGKATWVLKRLSPGDLGLPFEELSFEVRDARRSGRLSDDEADALAETEALAELQGTDKFHDLFRQIWNVLRDEVHV